MSFDLPGMETVTLSERGVTVQVRTLDGAPLKNSVGEDIKLIVHGPDSMVYKRVMQQQIKQRMERVSPSDITDETIKMNDDEAADMLAALVIGWFGVRDRAGAEVAFTRGAAKALFLGFPVIRDQIDVFVSKRANFTSPA